MRLSNFRENDSVLLVGDGNFSFSVNLCQKDIKLNVTASSYKEFVDQNSEKKNIEYLKKYGIRVFLGIDATNLQQFSCLANNSYDRIIFNFPHVGGKMRIDKNRELLKKFFVSCEPLIKPNGRILVSLCKGQGGTFFDNPKRRWNDTWKIVEMAAHGNLVLDNVEPFEWKLFNNYTVTGYRGLDKKFHTAGALVHIFRKVEYPCLSNIIMSEHMVHQMKTSVSTVSYSNAPLFAFHITLTVGENYMDNFLYKILYNCATSIVENVQFLQSYHCPIRNKIKRTYSIRYRSCIVPLHKGRIIDIHKNIIINLIENELDVLVDK